MLRTRTRTVAGVLLTLCASSDTWGQTTVIVEGVSPRRSATITQADLEAGVYHGQTFTLGPDTTIVLRNNGRLGTLGSMAAGPFDLAGTVVRAEAGGAIAGYYESFFSNATVTLLEGASTIGELTLRDVTLHVAGGEIGGPYGDSLNIAGGTIRVSDGMLSRAWLEAGTELHVTGGTVGHIGLEDNCVANLSGGAALYQVYVGLDSEVNLFGGSFMHTLRSLGGRVNVYGDELRINNVPAAALPDPGVGDPSGPVITATLADGTPVLIPASLPNWGSFIRIPLAAPDPTPIIVPDDPAPSGLRPGQTLVLEQGGQIGANLMAVDATLDIRGGAIGPRAQLIASNVQMIGGVLERDASLRLASTLTAFGTASIEELRGYQGSRSSILGGTHGELYFSDGSAVTLAGGTSTHLGATVGASVTILGGDFRVDGAPITELDELLDESHFYGTLADGSTFLYGGGFGGFAADTVTLVTMPLPPLNLAPILIGHGQIGPNGLRDGQTLTLRDGGTLRGNFTMLPGTTLLVEGGVAGVGGGMKTLDATITVTGGQVYGANALGDATIEIQGGSMIAPVATEQAIVILNGGTVSSAIIEDNAHWQMQSGELYGYTRLAGHGRMTMTGGSAWVTRLEDDSSVEIQGGTVLLDLWSQDRSSIVVSGGVMEDRVDADDNSTLTITDGTFMHGIGLGDFAHASISGGVFNARIGSAERSTLDISGGSFLGGVAVGNQSTTISGGSFSSFLALDDGTVNLVVRDISVGGVPLDLAPGEVRIIEERGTSLLLESTLAGGSMFNAYLDPVYANGKQWVFEPTVTLTARLATPPCQCDTAEPSGQINIADLLAYLDDWFRQEPAADLDANGHVDTFDLHLFIDCWFIAASTGFCDP